MSAPTQQDSRFQVEFQSVPFGTGHHISGSFCLDIPLAVSPDQPEQQIEIAGQQFTPINTLSNSPMPMSSASLRLPIPICTNTVSPRSPVSVPNASPMRIETLLRYLWNKREIIVNDEERKGTGWRVASTQVEKWNDLRVAQRCKGRGMT